MEINPRKFVQRETIHRGIRGMSKLSHLDQSGDLFYSVHDLESSSRGPADMLIQTDYNKKKISSPIPERSINSEPDRGKAAGKPSRDVLVSPKGDIEVLSEQ